MLIFLLAKTGYYVIIAFKLFKDGILIRVYKILEDLPASSKLDVLFFFFFVPVLVPLETWKKISNYFVAHLFFTHWITQTLTKTRITLRYNDLQKRRR